MLTKQTFRQIKRTFVIYSRRLRQLKQVTPEFSDISIRGFTKTYNIRQ